MPRSLPKISLITPTLNQAQFIRQTIRSILSQKYPKLEYIIIDGGSTDSTVGILKSYRDKIIWVSEKDEGQSDAINKGLKMATGDIVAYLNSDDYLEERSLWKIGEYFSQNKKAYWLTGKCKIVDKDNKEIRVLISLYKNFFLKYLSHINLLYIVQFVSQPATFWRREILKKVGFFDKSLFYSMDYDYWLRLMKYYKLYFLDTYIASYRIHQTSKTVANPIKQFAEEYLVMTRYTQNPLIKTLHKLHNYLALLIYKRNLLGYSNR